MKKLIFLTTLLFSSVLYSADDTAYYNQAFAFILGSNFVKERLSNNLQIEKDSIQFKVSNQIISFSVSEFRNEIIDYECGACSDSAKNILALYIGLSDYRRKIGVNSKLNELNINQNFNVLVFFSKLINNRLVADVRIYDKNRGEEYSEYNITPPGAGKILYYFYFNDYQEIIHVFFKELSG